MATTGSERSAQPVLLQTAEPIGDAEIRPPRRSEPKFGIAALVFSVVLSAFWAGSAGGYLWGYFEPKGVA